MTDNMTPVVRRDGSVHIGIFRVGHVRREVRTWAGPEHIWASYDRDGAACGLASTRRTAVSFVTDAWQA